MEKSQPQVFKYFKEKIQLTFLAKKTKRKVIKMSEKTIITKKGYQNLKKELKQLKEVERKKVTKKIKEARDFDGIEDNPGHKEAKNEKAFIEGRIQELENILKNVKVIKPKEVSKIKVGVGNTVKIKNLDSDEVFTYEIVGSIEADPSENKISYKSPIGNALMDKKAGAKTKVETPLGIKTFEILSIKKPKET